MNQSNTHSRSALLTVPEMAEFLGISHRKAWQLVSDGEITASRIGRSVRIRPEALDDFIRRCEEARAS